MNHFEIQKDYKQRLYQLEEIGKLGNPIMMKKLDAQFNQEYKQLLSEFHLISAKLSLLKKLCGESQRLTRYAIKGKKRVEFIVRRARVEEENSNVLNNENNEEKK